MEGRALNKPSGKQWAWLVPWFAGGVANIVSDAAGAERATHFAVGVLAGMAWQLLCRRDLTSRLTFMAGLVGFGIVAVLATREPIVWDDMDTVGLYAIGILLGLIYTEHYQRLRDRAHARAVPFAEGIDGVPR